MVLGFNTWINGCRKRGEFGSKTMTESDVDGFETTWPWRGALRHNVRDNEKN
jgi:hypothetical protein